MDKDRWHKIEEIFHAANSLPAGEITDFLARECGNDRELRLSVESLLEHADKDTGLSAVVEQAAHSMLSDKADMSGEHIGPYLVAGVLGQGGMGAVYLAERDDDQYRQRVAIKLIRHGVANREILQRFRIERQILANLEHPFIARLLDGGSTQSGLPYLVMEYVEGQPIDAYCNSNSLNTRERLKLFQKVCSAVQYAHQKLVVHRDLKPSNLLVTETGEPKLLDFGIAKLLDTADIEQTVLETHVEARLHTPRYSSPEQVAGKPVSTVTDVYALGVVLYELLTGSRPYGSDRTDRISVEQAILKSEPVRPSVSVTGMSKVAAGGKTQFDFSGIEKDLTGDLDNIILMALRKEPERRYQSVAQFSADIQNFLEQRPVIARPTSWFYRSGKFVRRHRFGSAVTALLISSLVGFSIFTWDQSKTIALERDLAQLEKAKAVAITEFLANMFSEVTPDNARGKIVTVREVLDKAGEQLDKRGHALASQPETEAAIRRVIGGIYTDLGFSKPAETHLTRALGIHEEQGLGDREELLLVLLALSRVYHQQFREEESREISNRALEISKQVHGEDHRHTLGIMNALAGSYQMMGNLEAAEELFLDVYNKRISLLGRYHPDTLTSELSLGVVYQWMGRFEDSEKFLRLCMDGARKNLGNDHPLTLDCMGALGSVLETTGEYAAAEPVISEHVERAALIQGERHPATLRSMHNLADTYRGLARYDESEALFLKTLDTRRDALGLDHIETLQTQMKLARLYRIMERYDEAEPLVEDTVAKQRAALGRDHPTTLIATQVMADLYRAQGRGEEALQLYLLILQAREKALGADHPELQDTLAGLASIHLAKGMEASAEGYLLRAFKLAEDNPAFKSERISEILRMLIQLYESSGTPEKATLYRERLASLE